MLIALENYETEQARRESETSGGEVENDTEVLAEENSEADAAAQLQAVAGKEENKLGRADLQAALQELAAEYRANPSRGIVLAEVAGGWQFRTRPENAALLQQFYQAKPTKLSKPSLETLAIVAYRQPIIRAEIDAIRGVDSGGVLKTLLEKNLIRIVGKQDDPGKPMLYGTTQDFLELFQLKSLQELPTLKEFRELEEEFQRKSGKEGVVVENETEESSEDAESSLLEGDAVQEIVAALDAEDQTAIEELESSLKELRDVEREIFKEDKEEEV
ncbi:MAG TPA: SMC-Scp complex subunit ScpB [Deltaproteobacteria bacterium]|nr:SMC-Scp complex subunit ScpB [Deltaproteobacteria bacterium]